MELNLKLTLDEVNFVLSMLGEMPTKTSAWKVYEKMRSQAEEQLKPAVIQEASVGSTEE